MVEHRLISWLREIKQEMESLILMQPTMGGQDDIPVDRGRLGSQAVFISVVMP